MTCLEKLYANWTVGFDYEALEDHGDFRVQIPHNSALDIAALPTESDVNRQLSRPETASSKPGGFASTLSSDSAGHLGSTSDGTRFEYSLGQKATKGGKRADPKVHNDPDQNRGKLHTRYGRFYRRHIRAPMGKVAKDIATQTQPCYPHPGKRFILPRRPSSSS
jgi:hypothetical protein